VGGPGPLTADSVSAVYGNFPLMIFLIALVTYILLARAFRSLLLPLKAIGLNIVSVGAAWGIMVLIWQDGFGSSQIWGVQSTGAIIFWIPLMVFAFLFGLSMDYEVFILAGHGIGGRHSARCHRGSHASGTGAGVSLWAVELVASRPSSSSPAPTAVCTW